MGRASGTFGEGDERGSGGAEEGGRGAALLDEVVGGFGNVFESLDGDVASRGSADGQAEVRDLGDVGDFGLGVGVREEGDDLVWCEAGIVEEGGEIEVGAYESLKKGQRIRGAEGRRGRGVNGERGRGTEGQRG
jgi:hypothetical protein